MIFDTNLKARLRVGAVVAVLSLAAACGDDDDDGGGDQTFSCGTPGKFCAEYTGANIDSIRDATMCTDQEGAVEGSGCPDGAALICMLPRNGGGTSGAQYYYGDTFDEDDIPSLKAACEAGGGTFVER